MGLGLGRFCKVLFVGSRKIVLFFVAVVCGSIFILSLNDSGSSIFLRPIRVCRIKKAGYQCLNWVAILRQSLYVVRGASDCPSVFCVFFAECFCFGAPSS